MKESEPTRDDRTEQLRRQWLGYAAAAFDLMFHPEHQPDLTSFDQRERRVVELTDDLKTWLLQQHLAADPAACPDQAQTVCPRCGQPAKPVGHPDQPLEERHVSSLAGEVALKRQKWRCATCRVAFFPSGPETRSGR